MTWYSPPGHSWQFVSKRLMVPRLLGVAVFAAIALTAATMLEMLVGGWTRYLIVAAAIVALWCAFVVVRQVTAHAWAERDDDLVIKRGRLWRRVTVVPYGRMQYVEVSAGPLARGLGIARVQLHTASPGTDAHISGVPAAEAERLRDRLTSRGQARLAGL